MGDAVDPCPQVPGEPGGCPLLAMAGPQAPLPLADVDGDGFEGDDDRCPYAAEDRDGFRDADGCPDLDDDGDGVPDAEDRCPRVAETSNGHLDADGCPDEAPRRRRGRRGGPR